MFSLKLTLRENKRIFARQSSANLGVGTHEYRTGFPSIVF